MHTIHRRALHGALPCGSLTVSHSQLPVFNKHQYVGLSRGSLSGQQKQRLLSGVDPSSTKSCPGISTNAHRTAVSLHQRQNSSQEHGQHNQHSTHHHRQLRDDGSLKIIMLLGLSLTLLLIPWVSHHPEFLLAPFVLAVTPVVGNGVRPVLKELGAGLVTTLRLMGMAAWFDITHELPPAAQHHNHHNNHGHGSSQPQQQQPAPQYARDPYQQQQQQAYQMQQQQPRPSGPHSPWPNPAYMPANWPPAQQQQQQPAAVRSNQGVVVSHPISNDAVADWAPSSPPDPHRGDPNSLQHLRQVLAADLQTETELGQQRSGAGAAAMTAGSSSGSNAVRSMDGSPRQLSPAGSPQQGNSPASSFDAAASSFDAASSSFDAADFGLQQQQQQQAVPQVVEQQQQQQQSSKQQQQQSRDPRVLSKRAKQQLYQNHHNHLHQHQQGGGSSSNS